LDDAVQIGTLCWTPYENRVEAISKKSLAELPLEAELRPAA
jgi:hypothetical protein